MTRTYVDIHILQTVPPSNLNRDDTGSPKSAVYGGVRRARVSSQAWKRATRLAFADLLPAERLGTRTKRIVELVAAEIAAQDASLSERAAELAEAVLKKTDIKVEKPKRAKEGGDTLPEAGYLVFLSRSQIRQLAALAVTAGHGGDIDVKQAKAAADTEHSIDLALFGRMVADATDLTVDASAQVAHAISVHAVENEFDYFTAVDDLKERDESAGAGMIGTVEFNSSTLYRYATVDVPGLVKALGDDTATIEALGAFVRAFVTSMPTGKQNTFANRTLPDAVVVAIRSDQPVNLVGAFEEAVQAGETGGRLTEASRRLADYSAELDRAYGSGDAERLVVRAGAATEPLAALGREVSLDELVSRVTDSVRARLGTTVS